MTCTCQLISEPREFPPRYDQSTCPTHGPDAPQFFIDHGTIHCRVTGKHVSIEEAVDLLNIESGTTERIAWKIAADLGTRLREAETERNRLRDAIPCSACGASDWQIHNCVDCMTAARTESERLTSALATYKTEYEEVCADRARLTTESERLRGEVSSLCAVLVDVATRCRHMGQDWLADRIQAALDNAERDKPPAFVGTVDEFEAHLEATTSHSPPPAFVGEGKGTSGDTTTDFNLLLSPRAGETFDLDLGAVRIDEVTESMVAFTVWANPSREEDRQRWSRQQWREAVERYRTRNDQPTMTCPKCGGEMEDFDGIGVLAHLECGYCTHPSLDGNVCGICQKTVDTHGGIE